MPPELPVEITPSYEEYKKAAEKWHRVIMKLPVLAAKDTTKYMTGLPGCRTNQHIGSSESKAQFYPYVANKRGNASTKINFEVLEIYFGSMIHDFVPDDEVQTILGEHADTMGPGMSKSEIAKLVIAGVMESAGEELALAIPTAVRNDNGDLTMDLFNGHVTVIEKAITDGKVSEANKNLVILGEPITVNNVVQILKEIEFKLDRRLRKQERFLYCDPAIVDLYNEGYLLTHMSVPYNDKYEQAYVEGSNKRMTFAPLDGLAGTGVMWIAPKKNVLYGYDGMSDAEKCEVKQFQPDTLTLNAKMFFGTGFRTFDYRFLKVIKAEVDMDGDPGEGEEVYPQPSVSPINVELDEGETVQLRLDPETGWTFMSTDESVATVDANGEITAVGVGTAKIYCDLTDGTTERVTVTVYEASAGDPDPNEPGDPDPNEPGT